MGSLDYAQGSIKSVTKQWVNEQVQVAGVQPIYMIYFNAISTFMLICNSALTYTK